MVDPGLLGAGEGSELLEADGEPEVPGGLQGGRALLEDPGELALDLQDEDVLLVGAEGLVAGQVVEEEEGERDQGGDGLVLGFGRGGRKKEGMAWARSNRHGEAKARGKGSVPCTTPEIARRSADKPYGGRPGGVGSHLAEQRPPRGLGQVKEQVLVPHGGGYGRREEGRDGHERGGGEGREVCMEGGKEGREGETDRDGAHP